MEEDVPGEVTESVLFEDLGLDMRIIKAIEKDFTWERPTLIQSAAIPLVFKGKDILARARTGSGKTGAYSIPIVQTLLNETNMQSTEETMKGIQSLVLVPTRELCYQVKEHFHTLTFYCADVISVLALTADDPFRTQQARLSESPDILITTPKVLRDHLKKGTVSLQELRIFAIDEADYIFSFGFEGDMKEIVGHFPPICQGLLMSATLSTDVDALKKLVLHTPAVLELEEAEANAGSKLEEYSIKCVDSDKFLISYVLLKLQLLPGKVIFFTNSVDRSFRLKLFFEQFSIPSAVLNSELPENSRYHIVQEFNKGVFNYLIATDTDEIVADVASKKKQARQTVEMDSDDALSDSEDEKGSDEEAEEAEEKDENTAVEYGVSRGVDFKRVDAVVNFDFPTNLQSYVHRTGRTARGTRKGTALSFVTVGDEEMLKKVQVFQQSKGTEIQPYEFKMKLVEGFRYRVEDVLHCISRTAVRNARVLELKNEILNSKKLKAHFEENPEDVRVLQHHRHLQQKAIQPNLRIIPDYLIPKEELKEQRKLSSTHPSKRKNNSARGRNRKRQRIRDNDPLNSFGLKKKRRDWNRKRKRNTSTMQDQYNATNSKGKRFHWKRNRMDPEKAFLRGFNKRGGHGGNRRGRGSNRGR